MNRFLITLRLIETRDLILALGIALGLILGEPVAKALSPLALPALGVMIALSASDVSLRAFTHARRVAEATGVAVLANYVINVAVLLGLAALLVPESDLFTGYVLVAAAPPAAVALGFAITLHGDVLLSLLGTVGAYGAALALGPLIAYLFARPGLLPPGSLFGTLLTLVLLPLVGSRLLRLPRVLPVVRRWRELAISAAFALVVWIVVGVNRAVFISQPGLIGLIALVAIGATFGIGAAGEVLLRRAQVSRGRRVSLLLLATMKNSGFAAAVALALVSARASLPGAVVSVVNALFLIWFGLAVERPK